MTFSSHKLLDSHFLSHLSFYGRLQSVDSKAVKFPEKSWQVKHESFLIMPPERQVRN